MNKAAQKSGKTREVRKHDENGGALKPAEPLETHDQIVTLQRSLGNQGLGRLLQLSSNQPGVSIGAPASQHEQKADRVATQVSQRRPAPEQVSGLPPLEEPHASISSSFGAGQPLPEAVRESLEPQFGYDLSQVRVHTGGLATESARLLNASAFTVGKDIAFGAGQYAPETSAGQRLITHEMAHVVQQGIGTAAPQTSLPLIQRSPGPAADLELPWTQGGISLFEVTAKGVRFLAGVGTTIEADVRKAIPKIAERVSKDNSFIKDPKFQVATVFITPTTTRFSLLNGEPVLMLDPSEADAPTAAHEMGHAIFYALENRGQSKAKDASAARDFTLEIADIWDRLSGTKLVKMKGTLGKEETHPIGHWMVDPSQWKAGAKAEHPWDDPDEFFGSAKAAYQTDRAALVKSIEKAIKTDSKVKAPAKELIALLDDFLGSGKLSPTSLTSTRVPAAEAALKRRKPVGTVESTLGAKPNQVLRWILEPSRRPVETKAEPGVTAPSEATKPAQQPNLVTGPGGVVDRLKKKMDDRMREKILESVHDLP